MTHPYLKDKIVILEAIANPKKWEEHFGKFKGTDVFEFNKLQTAGKPYNYPNAEKRYCVPLSNPGVKPTLDNSTKNACPDFQNMELTEQEYFERKLNKNLNPYLPEEENWWTDIKRNSIAFPLVKEGKLRLNLSKPEDMLQYRIFQEHYQDEVAFSLAELRTKKLSTYIYVIKDTEIDNSAFVNTGKLRIEANVKCAEIMNDKESIIKFFACVGKTLDPRQDIGSLQKPLMQLLEDDPEAFLKIATDKDADIKYLIYKARKSGVITYSPKKEEYTLTSGKMGKLHDIIDHLKQLRNQEELLELKVEVESKYTGI